MVNALDSGSSGPGLSPGRGHCVVSCARNSTSTVPPFTQVCKWVLVNLMLGESLRLTRISSRDK